jgi:hypothetical protein
MKVIDMLDRIANGEEVKFKIIETDEVLNLTKDMHLFSITWNEPVEWMIDEEWLNYEVEIIEEDKKIEKVNTYVLCDYDFKNKDDDNNLIATNILDKALEEYSHKINEIIDKLNEMEKE